MNPYLDHLVAQSIAREREHDLQQALRQRRAIPAGRRPRRPLAAAAKSPLRARLAHPWAPSQ